MAAKRFFQPGETILVVEDERHMLELVKLSAEKRGFQVFTVAYGEQAIDTLSKTLEGYRRCGARLGVAAARWQRCLSKIEGNQSGGDRDRH